MTTAILPLETIAPRTEDADLVLVRAMARGDARALETLYARHGSGVLSYLAGRVGDRALAEEVLQDVMLAAWRHAGAFRGDARVRTWLLTVAHHRAVNAIRRHRPVTVALDAAPRALDIGPSEPADSAGERTDLRRAIATLPDDQRAALELVFFHELSIAEAAGVLGVAEGTVKSRLHRAKHTLRGRLEPAALHDADHDGGPR